MVRANCADVLVTAGPSRTGSTWQEGVGSVLNLIPGFREASDAGRAVQFAAISISILALVGVGILIYKASRQQ